MIYVYILGLLPIILVFLMTGIFTGCMAKKYGKNPWLFGGFTVVFITFASWQYIPRWAGAIAYLEIATIKFSSAQVQAVATEPRDPSMIEQFTLSTKENLYTFGLPATYHAAQALDSLIEVNCKYPAMEATQRDRLGEGVLSIQISTGPGSTDKPQFFLNKVAANTTRTTVDKKLLDKLVGKQGNYDVFQRQSKRTNETETTLVFTAKDGQLVLVEQSVFGHRIRRNIRSDIAISYGFFPEIGDDFIKIDEVVSNFIKTHLKSQPLTR